MPVEMNGIELSEETSFPLLGLIFTRSIDWKPYIQSTATVVHGEGRVNKFLLLK